MPLLSGRRGLAGGQAVNLVIHDDIRQVEIASHSVDKMVEADAVTVAVTARDHHVQPVVGKLRATRHRHRPAVQTVDAVGVEEPRQVRRAADARDHEDVLSGQLQPLRRELQRPQHAEVTAPGTPVRIHRSLVGFER